MCLCKKDGKCHAFDLKECFVCHNILKSHCGNQACRNAAAENPKMLLVDAALKHSKQVVRYDDTTDDEMSCVESDTDAEMSDEDTETESLSVQKLFKVWKSLSPPNHEETLLGNWYGVIYEQEKKKILFIAKLLNRFLHDKDGSVQSLPMKCLKRKCGPGNVLEDTTKHLPDGIDNFCLSDIICWAIDCHPKGLTKVGSTEL